MDEQERGQPPLRRAARPRSSRPGRARRSTASTSSALLIDGVHLGDHCLIVALGIAADGQKHALGPVGRLDGECDRLPGPAGESPESRPAHRPQPARDPRWLKGACARRCARPSETRALVQRCQVHKTRNILEYLNDRQRPWAQAILRRAYQSADVKTAQRLLTRSRAASGDRASRARPRAYAKASTRRSRCSP